jgi:CRP/FNR family cyclic AMP-dependent transcriptional regulator
MSQLSSAWGAPVNRTRQAAERAGAQHLFDLDPELGAALRGEERARARSELRVRVHSRRRGPWNMAWEAATPTVGVLILDGVIASDTLLEDIVSTELLGPGDILRPWPLDEAERLLDGHARWTVLADCRVAVLGSRFTAMLNRYPAVYAALLERVDRRARRLATMQAIAQLTRVDRRLLAILWHLAERWGRVTPDGVLIPLDISHRLLAQLVGARRPTVSTALGELAREGTVQRRSDGAWILRGEPSGTPTAGDGARMSRRRLLVDAGGREAAGDHHGNPASSRPEVPGRANQMP